MSSRTFKDHLGQRLSVSNSFERQKRTQSDTSKTRQIDKTSLWRTKNRKVNNTTTNHLGQRLSVSNSFERQKRTQSDTSKTRQIDKTSLRRTKNRKVNNTTTNFLQGKPWTADDRKHKHRLKKKNISGTSKGYGVCIQNVASYKERRVRNKESQVSTTIKKTTRGIIPLFLVKKPIATTSAAQFQNIDDPKKETEVNMDMFKDEKEPIVSELKLYDELTSQLKMHLEEFCFDTGSKLHIEKHPCKLERWMNLKVTSEIPVIYIDYDTANPWQSDATEEKHGFIKETVTLVLMIKYHINIFRGILPKDGRFQKILKELDEFLQMADHIIVWSRPLNRKFFEMIEIFIEQLKNSVMPSLTNISEELRLLKTDKEIHFKITESELFCGIMGFESSFSSRLHNLGDSELGHETPLYYFKKWIKMTWDKRDENRNAYCTGDNLKQMFVALGFTTERSNSVFDNKDEYFLKSQTGLYWALRYTDMMFASHPLLSSCSRKPPYKTKTSNEWFDQKIKSDRAYDGIKECDIKMINVNSYDESRVLQKLDELRNISEQSQHKLWFHGTPSFEYAESILKEGILLSKGTENKDFSKKHGFYLSDDFEKARKWAKINSENNNYAVLVFSVPQEGLTENFLDLENVSFWKKVVRCYRSGFKEEVDLKNGIRMSRDPGVAVNDPDSEYYRLVKLNDFDMIRGPICLDVGKIMDKNCREAPVIAKDGSGRVIQQMCVRGKQLAKNIGSLNNIPAALWFTC